MSHQASHGNNKAAGCRGFQFAGNPRIFTFKAWGYPWTNLGVLLASAAFLVATVVGDLKDALFTLILISLSYPVYFFVARRRRLLLSTAETDI
jgi:hypothetical protein